jgi:uncharacterized protein
MTAKRTIKLLSASIAGLALGMAALATVSLADPPQSHSALVVSALEKHILPRVAALDAAAAPLAGDVKRVCENGDDASREDLSGHFRQTVQAWAAVEFLRFGPMIDAGLREKISFWPDPRGILARQMRQFLVTSDVKDVEGGAIAKQSAALQGLPALEVLLTDKDAALAPGAASAFRCAFALAIAENVSGLTHRLREAWSKDGGWKDKMLRPGSDNDTYKDSQESAAEVVKALLVGFQLIADMQVKPRLEAAATLAGPFEKANLSKAYFASSVASLQALYDAVALEDYLPGDKDWVKNWAGGAWRVMQASDGAGGRSASAAKDEAPVVRVLFDRITGLRKLILGEMSPAAGLTVGFNELDGD